MDPHFNADNFTHNKSISIVSMGLQVLCEFVTYKKFQMRFGWCLGLICLVILLCYHILYHFYLKKPNPTLFSGNIILVPFKKSQWKICNIVLYPSLVKTSSWMLLFSIGKSGKLIQWFLISTKTLIFVHWVQLSCAVYFYLSFLCMWTVLPLAFIISCTFIPSLSLAVRTSCMFL